MNQESRIERNVRLRKELVEWRDNNFRASYRVIAEKVGLNYQYLSDWRRGRFVIADKALDRIEKFIKNNGITG